MEKNTHTVLNSQFIESVSSTDLKLPSKGYFKLDLHQAWINFIKSFEPFQWFVTLTFKEPRHPEACNKAFYRWIRNINQCLYGRRYRENKKGVTWIKAIEYQRREVVHFHCLVGSPELCKLKRLDFMKVWETDCMNTQKIINGYARISKYDHNRGAINYCSKYVLKGGEIDLYISPEQWYLLSDNSPMLGKQFVH